jgi:hypothetical protein
MKSNKRKDYKDRFKSRRVYMNKQKTLLTIFKMKIEKKMSRSLKKERKTKAKLISSRINMNLKFNK